MWACDIRSQMRACGRVTDQGEAEGVDEARGEGGQAVGHEGMPVHEERPHALQPLPQLHSIPRTGSVYIIVYTPTPPPINPLLPV